MKWTVVDTGRPLLALPGAWLVGRGVDVDGGVSEIDPACAHAVAGRIEDVAVTLLNRNREILLGLRLELAHLCLLVLGEVLHSLGLLQLAKREPLHRAPAHLLLAVVVGDDEHHSTLLKPRDDLLADRLVPRVDVVHVNSGRVRRPRLPQVRDGTREQPQLRSRACRRARRSVRLRRP